MVEHAGLLWYSSFQKMPITAGVMTIGIIIMERKKVRQKKSRFSSSAKTVPSTRPQLTALAA